MPHQSFHAVHTAFGATQGKCAEGEMEDLVSGRGRYTDDHSLADRAIPSDGGEVHCTISAGIAMVKPGDGSVEDALRRADDALIPCQGQWPQPGGSRAVTGRSGRYPAT